jgi:hypothetical protein
MSMEYLVELEEDVDKGKMLYACAPHSGTEWHIASSIEEVRKKAQRTANARKMACPIFHIINKMETGEGDSFLVVKKVGEPGPKGEPHVNWTLVDTREAAETLRDVSCGPTPYFGATIEETVDPTNIQK